MSENHTNPNELSHFAKNLSVLLKERDLTGAKLERDLKWGKNTISSYLSKKTEPNHHRTILLANYFKIDIDDLLKETPYSKQTIPTIQQNNNGGVGNTNIIQHTESEWAGMQQRITDLEAIIELQKKYIARLESDVEKNN